MYLQTIYMYMYYKTVHKCNPKIVWSMTLCIYITDNNDVT